MHRALLLLVVLAATAPQLAAQGSIADLQLASRVRVFEAGSKLPTVGMLTHLDDGSIGVSNANGEQVIARSTLARLEVSRGVHSNAGRGAVWGGIIGGGAFLALGIAAYADSRNSWFEFGAEWIPVAAAAGAVLGAGVGGSIGALSHSERWQRVDMDPRPLSLFLAPSRHRVIAGLAARF